LLPILIIRLIFKNLQDKDYLKNFSNRLGFYKIKSYQNIIWFHAVSLGEVISSQKIVKKLLEDNKVILSVSTPTGLREAKKIYGQNLLVVYAPWDFSIFVKSFLNKFRPKALILFETEIWPSMIHACWKNNIPVILSNARLSESSYKKYEFINVFINSTLNKLSLILAQSHEHASRFKALGINNDIIFKVGSTKFDLESDNEFATSDANLCHDFILAASTHKGEDELIISSYLKLKEEFKDLKLVLVPRHPERANTIKDILKRKNMDSEISSDIKFNLNKHDVVVINATGLLNILYKRAKVSFIGGSLFSKYGGHNIIEPAFNKSPFIVGPHMKNFEDVLSLFLKKDACIQLKSPVQLHDAFKKLLNNDELRTYMIDNAIRVVSENKGSSNQQYKYIKHLIN
jgi:3-deoxy-D-manno-octulosonic-acid transferase